MDIIQTLTQEFNLKEEQVKNTVDLIDEGNTIPFIARYRKEVTGSLDDTVLRDLVDRLTYLRNIEKRKEEVKGLIAAQEKMTDEISAAIDAAKTITEVDDIYRPFRPHRKTRASVARERGLEPLAELIMSQQESYDPSLEAQAASYVNEEKGVESAEEALKGAMDIIAENVSDNAEFRKEIRSLTFDFGFVVSKATTEADTVYAPYYDYNEKINKIPSHRVLAINRGEKEEYLKVSLDVDPQIVLNFLYNQIFENTSSPAARYIREAIDDSYERLIAPSVEREIRADLFDTASEGAIKLFSENLKHLLMQPPIKGKTVLGFDPGYVNGCKTAVVDKTGKVIDTAVVYPTTKSKSRIEEAKRILSRMIRAHKVDVIAIGNGTASKESELFIADLLKELDRDVKYIVISEAGASVYSASKLAAEEFPDFDVMQRSAVSIARRLQDPLAELVKIEPRSIGVGQYQHDMKPARLDGALGGVVEDCVNSVGVDLNTASVSLLKYVAGLNAAVAKNIVAYREANGKFKSRKQLLKVHKLGEKAYTQCAGFLRIDDGENVFDNTAVHPESYEKAEKLLGLFHYTKDDVRARRIADLRSRLNAYGEEKAAKETDLDKATLADIVTELMKPGRDIRESFPAPVLRKELLSIADLKVGMEITGTVRNVVDFGAFVDIGVHQDGLVHISEITDKFIRHPSEALKVGQVVQVRVKEVDVKKNRIGLTMRKKNK